jgi:hypothetical protein
MIAREIVLSCFLAVFQPRSTLPLGDWMAANIQLRPTENPGKPGPYDAAYTPLPARLLSDFFASPDWDELHVQKSSQASLSFHTLGYLVRKVGEEPGNAMYVIDSDKEAKNISARLEALLHDCPVTANIMAAATDDVTALTYRLPGMNLWLTGSGSAGSLGNKTAVLGISDETDKHKSLPGEANTVDLLRSRLKEQIGAKLLDFSTPTLVHSQIHQEYQTGSRHKAHVPCPHCDFFQELVWERVKFDHCKDLTGEWDLTRVLDETYYECSSCEGHIYDRHKREMMARGEWRPSNFRLIEHADGTKEYRPAWIPRKMSAHYSDLYSQNENVSFGRLAVKFLSALKDPMKMRDFLQNHMGLPDQESVAEVTEDKILALRGAYRRQRPAEAQDLAPIDGDGQHNDTGTPIPIRPLFCALLADTQDANSKWTLQAFSANGDQYVIDWGSCLELSDLDDIAARAVRWAAGGESGAMDCAVAMIDEGGHRTYEVRQHAYPRYPACFTSRGSPGTGGSSISIRDYRIKKDDEAAPTMPVVVYDDSSFKRELYIRRIARFDAKKADAYNQARTWLPINLETSFTQELMKEKLERDRDGRLRWNTPKGNDYGDTLKMGLILWAYLSPELLRVQALEERENPVPV